MAGTENPLIALIDDMNAAQETARTNARHLIDRSGGDELRSKQLADIIKATQRTQRYLKTLRALVRELKAE